MTTSSMHHVSPSAGVSPCSAASPASCKFKNAKHFDGAAAQRIKSGNPRGYEEHEAMREHQQVMARLNMERGQGQPKPGPPPVRNVSQFPTNHRGQVGRPGGGRPRYGDEVLYHREIGFPRNFTPPSGVYELEYSRHALDASLDDRYGKMPVLQRLNVDRLQIVELGVQDGRVSKLVYRGHLDEDRDMVVVVIPKPRGQKWFVKTVWINLRSDAHKTLDHRKYAKPEVAA